MQASPGGKSASQPAQGGKSNSTPMPGSFGKSGTAQGQQPPNVLSLIGQAISGGGSTPMSNGQSGASPQAASLGGGGGEARNVAGAQGGPRVSGAPIQNVGYPVFNPMAQGYHGASSAQQNPNQGGASTSPSSMTQPSTTQGGMGASSSGI